MAIDFNEEESAIIRAGLNCDIAKKTAAYDQMAGCAKAIPRYKKLVSKYAKTMGVNEAGHIASACKKALTDVVGPNPYAIKAYEPIWIAENPGDAFLCDVANEAFSNAIARGITGRR